MPATAPTRQCVVEMGKPRREEMTTMAAELISTMKPV
jgi:hypothetical protein